MKKFFTLFFFTFLLYPLYSQSKINYDEEIIGIIITESYPLVITNTGYYKIQSKKNKWQEYYRKIYKDSTIVNPNTEIKGNFTINFVPYVLSDNKNFQKYYFEEPLKFGMLISVGEDNNYSLTNYGLRIFDSLNTEQSKNISH